MGKPKVYKFAALGRVGSWKARAIQESSLAGARNREIAAKPEFR